MRLPSREWITRVVIITGNAPKVVVWQRVSGPHVDRSDSRCRSETSGQRLQKCPPPPWTIYPIYRLHTDLYKSMVRVVSSA